ncbi:uncharacterized protein LOC105275067 [Ooceraea biroi]|nr:uncharacterized protein LOC105275067 [Ooceraea biroi]
MLFYFAEAIPRLCAEDWEITDAFRDVLKMSYNAAIFWKTKKLTGQSNGTVKLIEENLNNLYKRVITSTETNCNDIIAVATSYCNMGIVYKDCTSKKELRIGRSHLKRSLEVLKGKELDRRAILIVMRASLLLECILHKLDELNTCCRFSHKAIGFYLEYTKQLSSFPAPLAVLSASLHTEEPGHYPNTVRSLMTLFVDLLWHVKACDFDQWDLHDLTIPVHNFLMNRWTAVPADLVNEGFTWASITANFQSYFVRQHRFSDARNYLAATQYILDEYRKELKANQYLPANTNYRLVKTNVAYGWATYSNMLLLRSKCKLYKFCSQNCKTIREGASGSTSSVESEEESAEPLTFTWGNLEERIKDIASQVTDTYVTNWVDANLLFLHSTKWFRKIRKYFLKKGEIFFAINAAYNVTVTYEYLESFRLCRNTRIKMHKRRVRMLNDICVIALEHHECKELLLATYFDRIISYGVLMGLMLTEDDIEITEKEKQQMFEYTSESVECYENYLSLHALLTSSQVS